MRNWGAEMKPNAPCKDCTRRAVGCRHECEGWAVYEAAQAEWYADKVKTYTQNEMVEGYMSRKIGMRYHREHKMRRK